MNRRYRSLHVIHPFRLHLSRISNLDYEFSIRVGGVGSRFLPHDFRVLLIILPFMPPPNRTLFLSLSISLSRREGNRDKTFQRNIVPPKLEFSLSRKFIIFRISFTLHSVYIPRSSIFKRNKRNSTRVYRIIKEKFRIAPSISFHSKLKIGQKLAFPP